MWTKNTDKSMFFQAGDNSMQQLCQEGKLKRNSRVMCVCVCVCVCVRARALDFYPWIQGKVGGSW